MNRSFVIAVFLLIATALPVHARMGQLDAKAEAGNPIRQFEALIASIRVELEPGGKYAHVPRNDRPALESQLNLMATLLQGVDSIDGMSKHRKIRLFNAQEKVNGLLLQSEADRVQCETHKITGSHRPRTVCMTLVERENAKEDSQRLFRVYARGFGDASN